MALTLVQSASNGASPVVPSRTTYTTTVSKTLSSAVTAGNLIIVAVGTRNGDAGSISDTPVVTDSLGNTYIQIVWGNATGTQTQGIGIYYAKNVLGGACTVTFSCQTPNGNPIFALTSQMGLAIAELSGFGTLPIVQDSGINQTGSGSAPATVTLVDSLGASVTTSFGVIGLASVAAADISALGADYFVSARIQSTTPAPAAPSVTGAAWSYVVQENATDGAGSYPLLFAVQAYPVTTIAPVVAGGFVDRTQYLRMGQGPQHSFTMQLRQRGQATVELLLEADNDYASVRGCPLYLYDQTLEGFTRVFAGFIQDIENRYIDKAGNRSVLLTSVSLESVFDTVYAPPYQYVDKTCGYIVTDLFTRLEAGSPVILGTISDGPIIPLLNTNYEKLSDLFTRLATTAGFTWGINPETFELYFRHPSAIAAPFDITDAEILFDSIEWKQDGADYRNRQAIRLSQNAFPHSQEFFVGTGQTEFLLKHPVAQVTNAWATLSTPNTATGTFTGQPNDGDTVTIGVPAGAGYGWQGPHHFYALGGLIIVNGYLQKVTTAGYSGNTPPTWHDVPTENTPELFPGTAIWTNQGAAGLSTGDYTYTFKNVIDNTQFGQVLIGSDAAETCLFLTYALNADDTLGIRGLYYSLPTWENALCNAINIVGSAFTLQQKAAGTGWISALSESATNFAWSSDHTIGGTSPQGSLGPGEGATISLQVYVLGTSVAAPAVIYVPGSPVIHTATPLNIGSNLNVEYTRAGGDVIEVENTALVAALATITHGTGKYQQITDASTSGLLSTSAAAGLQFAQEALAAFSVAPKSFILRTHRPGMQVGMTPTVALDNPLGALLLLNGSGWIIEEITAEFFPTKVIQSNFGHYVYKLKLINIQEIGSYLDFWEGLGGGGQGGTGGGAQLVATSGGATPTITQTNPAGYVTHTTAALTAHLIAIGNGTDDVETSVPIGTAGQYLRSGGAGVDPAMASIAESEVTSLVTDLAAKVPATRLISTTVPLTGGGDLSADRTLAISAFVGDSGSGGVKGAVPAPAAGDAAAGKFVKADGSWAVPPGTGVGTVTHTAGALTAHALVLGNGSADETVIASLGTSGQMLKSLGSSTDPIFVDNLGVLGVVIDGGGAVPTTGSKRFRRVTYNCTITGWTILADLSGSCQITVKKSTYAGFPSTTSIIASAPPLVSSAQKATSTTLTGWTTTLTAGDVLEFNLDSVATCTWISLDLHVTRT